MKRHAIIVSVAVVAVIGLAAGAAIFMDSGGAYARGWWSGPPGGIEAARLKNGRHGRGLARLCEADREMRLEQAFNAVEGFISFTPEQTEAWSGLKERLRAGNMRIDATCTEIEAAGPPLTAPAALVTAERVVATGLGVLQDVRPAFEQLYDRLSDRQKEIIDGFVNRQSRR
jgi:LTXXQ motif family protein